MAIMAVLLPLLDPRSWHQMLPSAPLAVEGITPVCVLRERKDLTVNGWPAPQEWAMYLVCAINNGGRDTYIDSLSISGKLPLGLVDYMTLHSTVGHSISDIEEEFNSKRPFYRVRWGAWPTDSSAPFHLAPSESRLLIFTLWDPIISGQREAGWRVPREDYIGTTVPLKEPTRQCGFPSAQEFLSLRAGGHIAGMNTNLLGRSIVWQVRVNGEVSQIPSKLIRSAKVVSEAEWKSNPLIKILNREDVKLVWDKEANQASFSPVMVSK